ncbi:response regulator [Paenibacillus sp. GCM10023252]|uniref:response regulator n=1 Tax=Paenibacillus sp. GCM10023252 TaxID=3252649 RepID=UPI0036149714
MIPVMLVDDEVLVRHRIRSLLNWEELGFQIVAEAGDGEEALQQLEQCSAVDVLLVDINMPFLDGIALSRIVRDQYPDKQIVIVTGYSEFEYARTALSLGVNSYILKPIEVSELRDCLTKLKAGLDKAKYYREALHQAKSAVELQRSTWLNAWVLNKLNIQQEAFEEARQFYGIQLEAAGLQAAAIEIDDMDSRWMGEEEKQLWRFATRNVVDEILQGIGPFYAFQGDGNRLVYLIRPHSESDLTATCSRAAQAVKRYLKYTITIGIGRVYDGYDLVPRSYAEALEALRGKFTAGRGQVLVYTETAEHGLPMLLDATHSDSILIQLRMGKTDWCRERIEETFMVMRGGAYSKETMLHAAFTYLAVILRVLSECEPSPSELLNLDWYEHLSSKETMDDVAAELNRLLELAATRVARHRTRNTEFIERARAFIEEYYARCELSLADISAAVNISPSYFSTMFKKETGVGLAEYLADRRLSKANALIRENPMLTIQEIALRVGYSDPYYFSKSFKKKFGLSPSQYLTK